MILLDTNVVSELLRQRINPAVARFIGRRQLHDLFIPSVVAAELHYGLSRLPDGARCRDLAARLTGFLNAGFAARIVPFDARCAEGYAIARVARERAGRPVSLQDALIGGLALGHRAELATRNLGNFDGYGLTLLDPWQD